MACVDDILIAVLAAASREGMTEFRNNRTAVHQALDRMREESRALDSFLIFRDRAGVRTCAAIDQAMSDLSQSKHVRIRLEKCEIVKTAIEKSAELAQSNLADVGINDEQIRAFGALFKKMVE